MGFDWNMLLLGLVQGATEFLPVSSSGHLVLLQMFFGWETDGLLAFDLMLHCSTMLAVLIFFRDDIAAFIIQWLQGFLSRENRKSEGWTYGWAVIAGTSVTACFAIPLRDAVEAAVASPTAVGLGLLFTATLLCVAPLFSERKGYSLIVIGLVVGLAQGIAVFPGISRSGSTIAAALFMGLAAPEAFRLSFLMSVPVILGASILEARQLHASLTLPSGWLFSVLIAFVVGYIALVALHRLVLSGKWAYFGIYCFFLGLLVVASGSSI